MLTFFSKIRLYVELSYESIGVGFGARHRHAPQLPDAKGLAGMSETYEPSTVSSDLIDTDDDSGSVGSDVPSEPRDAAAFLTQEEEGQEWACSACTYVHALDLSQRTACDVCGVDRARADAEAAAESRRRSSAATAEDRGSPARRAPR